jgi:hypothetical protein
MRHDGFTFREATDDLSFSFLSDRRSWKARFGILALRLTTLLSRHAERELASQMPTQPDPVRRTQFRPGNAVLSLTFCWPSRGTARTSNGS